MKPLSALRRLSALRDLVRWREWHDSKIPLFLVGMFYAVLRMAGPGAAQLGDVAALVLLLCLFAAFGHIVNDYADRAVDRAAGKIRILATWREPAAVTAVVLPGIAAGGIAWARFGGYTFGLTVLAIMLAALYSLPPVRLKERGLLGWLTAAVAQRTLPLAIIFQALGGWDLIAVGLSMLSTLIGLRFIILHQLRDRDNDRRSGVRTVATENPPQRLLALLRWVFVGEIASLVGVLAAMMHRVPLLAMAALAYAASLLLATRRGKPISSRDYFVFYGLYCVIWPITLTLPLIMRNPVFLPLPCLVAALVQRHGWLRFREVFLNPVASPRSGGPDVLRRASRADAERRNASTHFKIDKDDPYPFYARLRATAPVIRADWPRLGTNWLVTRHREALTVLRDPRFIRDAARAPLSAARPQSSARPRRGLGHDMLELDPPDHTRLRKLISQAFTPRAIGCFEPRIEQLAHQILDRAKPRGQIELISEYASVIPIAIISEFLGVPLDDDMRVLVYSLTFNDTMGRSSRDIEALKLRFTGDLEGLFAQRRASPRDDLVTALVQAEQDGDRLSHDELIGMVYLLLVAGFVTTVNLIGNGMLALLRDPEQLKMLRQDPALADTAVEELLRFESPLALSPVCFAATDIELSGIKIPTGAPVRVLIASANRDETQFVAPDTLDITRNPCPHLSFGQGIHYCIGAPLARMEGKIAIRALLECAPELRIADPACVQWLTHPMFRGLRQLPLKF